MPTKEIRQCSSCGGFCKKSGCERENVPLEETKEPMNGCVCQWNSEGDRVVTCERHQGWLEVIAEWADRAREAEAKVKKLYASPQPQKPWVGFTDQEVDQFHGWKDCAWSTNELVRHVEAELKERNAPQENKT